MKINIQKRVLPLIVVVALLICCSSSLLVPAQAVEYTVVDFFATGSYERTGSSVTPLTSFFFYLNSSTYDFRYVYSVLYHLPTDCVFIFTYNELRDFLYGAYWTADGQLMVGRFYLPGYEYTYADFGVRYISDYECFPGAYFITNSGSYPVFRTSTFARAYSNETGKMSAWLCGAEQATYTFVCYDGSGNYYETRNTDFSCSSGVFDSSLRWYVAADCTFTDTYQVVSSSSTSDISVYNYRTSPYYPGLSQGFSVSVDGVELDATDTLSRVSWSVSGNSSSGTNINEYGILSIGPDEAASYVTVTATLKDDTTVSGSTRVKITPLPDADELYFMPDQTKYTAGQASYVSYYLAFADGSKFEYDGLSWSIDSADPAVTMSPSGVLSITSASVVGGFNMSVSFPWSDTPLKTAYIQLVDPDSSSSGESSSGSDSGDSGSGGDGSGTTETDPTDEKLDDIISGGEAGEELGNSSDKVDQGNEELGNTVDDLENAEERLPEMPESLESDIGNYVDSFEDSGITNLMPWNMDEYADFWNAMITPTLGSVSVALLLYFVFGKARAAA